MSESDPPDDAHDRTPTPGRLTEDVDYIIDDNGNLVFTAHYLRRRGTCCGNGCRNCPFDYRNVPPTRRRALLALRASRGR